MPAPDSTDIAFEARTFRLTTEYDRHEFGVYSGAEMIENNRETPELIEALEALGVGSVYKAGGGSAPVTIIERVS